MGEIHMSGQDGDAVGYYGEKIILLEKRIQQLEDWIRDEEYKRMQFKVRLSESVFNKEQKSEHIS